MKKLSRDQRLARAVTVAQGYMPLFADSPRAAAAYALRVTVEHDVNAEDVVREIRRQELAGQ